MKDDKLSMAIEIATKAHYGQVNHICGETYILHPIRIMLNGQTEEEMIVGVLHDVLEDSNLFQHEDIYGYFGKEISHAIFAITKIKREEYEEYIECVSKNKLARRVKIYDLLDNLNPTRIKNPTEKDRKREEKYKRALIYLSTINKGE